jgi:hypothetical protein
MTLIFAQAQSLERALPTHNVAGFLAPTQNRRASTPACRVSSWIRVGEQ